MSVIRSLSKFGSVPLPDVRNDSLKANCFCPFKRLLSSWLYLGSPDFINVYRSSVHENSDRARKTALYFFNFLTDSNEKQPPTTIKVSWLGSPNFFNAFSVRLLFITSFLLCGKVIKVHFSENWGSQAAAKLLYSVGTRSLIICASMLLIMRNFISTANARINCGTCWTLFCVIFF